MDDSYNKGLGLYLSIFQQKVPDRSTPLGWIVTMFQTIGYALTHSPRIMVLEYGIDGPGDMREMIDFVRPDVCHADSRHTRTHGILKTLDIVGEEEIQSVAAVRQFGVVNVVDVPQKFTDTLTVTWYSYGRDDSDTELSYTGMAHVRDGCRFRY